MNRQEHLLACLAEEAGEIVQAVGKALRFGLQDGYPGTSRTNEQDIKDECNQLLAVFEMLKCDVFKMADDEISRTAKTIDKKQKKVLEYMEYAEKTGALRD
jgi:NTP pyrophosphatase (non-canonical NTP hydrolase)